MQLPYKAEDWDFRLRAGSAAVDAGTPLNNVTDDFAERAPDLGALEVGKTMPHYGPVERGLLIVCARFRAPAHSPYLTIPRYCETARRGSIRLASSAENKHRPLPKRNGEVHPSLVAR
ncbi:MAG: hypothetical protein QOJ99_5755 [Bryobacterales bacterium]|nr:hypothetical protein [Bryobacterales bacterium]